MRDVIFPSAKCRRFQEVGGDREKAEVKKHEADRVSQPCRQRNMWTARESTSFNQNR